MAKFYISIRGEKGSSFITNEIEFDAVVRLVMEDHAEDHPTFEEASEWVDSWFENLPNSIDSNASLCYGASKWTILGVEGEPAEPEEAYKIAREYCGCDDEE